MSSNQFSHFMKLFYIFKNNPEFIHHIIVSASDNDQIIISLHIRYGIDPRTINKIIQVSRNIKVITYLTSVRLMSLRL